MSNDAAATRKQIVFKILRLWNAMPDETLGTILEEAFNVRLDGFKDATNKTVGKMLDERIGIKLELIQMERLQKKIADEKQIMAANGKHTAEDYVGARIFLNELKQYVYVLTKQEYQYLKGMALNGNVQEARNELYNIRDQKQALNKARKEAAVAGRK